MTEAIKRERLTAAHDGDIVVFLIGMRINRLSAVRRWWPVVSAMGPMLQYLYRHPEAGFLGHQGPYFSWRQVMLVQYWRSADDLERFAAREPDLHPAAWKRYYRESFQSGAAGIWHETYVVSQGNFENVYANMPVQGLGRVAGAVPVQGVLQRMRGRLSSVQEP